MNQILSIDPLRVIFGIPFAVFGVMHLMAADKMQGMVPSFISGGMNWVYITGVLLILGAAGFVINKSVQLAGYLLGGIDVNFHTNNTPYRGNRRRSKWHGKFIKGSFDDGWGTINWKFLI